MTAEPVPSGRRPRYRIVNREPRLVIGLIAAVTLLSWTLRLVRYFDGYDGFDTALLGNVLWRLANGLDDVSALTGSHYLATHPSPLMIPLLAVFRWAPRAAMPVVFLLQSASMGAVAWSLWRVSLAWALPGRTRAAVLVAALLSPGFFLATQLEVHEPTIGLGLLALAVAGALMAWPRWAVAGLALLAASARFELAAATLLAGLVLMMGGYRRRGIAVAAPAGLMVFLLGGWIAFNPFDAVSVAAHFAHLGDSPLEVVTTALRAPLRAIEPVYADRTWLGSLLFWLLPFGVVAPLLAPRWWLMGLPTVGIAIFGVWPAADVYLYHYWYGLLLIFGLASLVALVEREWLRERFVQLTVAGVAASWLVLVLWSASGFLFSVGGPRATDTRLVVDRVRSAPADWLVSAPDGVAARLYNRPAVTLYTRPFFCAESIIGPFSAPSPPPQIVVRRVGGSEPGTAEIVRLLNEHYRRVFAGPELEAWELRSEQIDGYVPCSFG